LRFRWIEAVSIIGGLLALAILAAVNPVLGFLAIIAVVALFIVRLLAVRVGDWLDFELFDSGPEVVLVVRARYGLGLDIDTTDSGVIVSNERGDRREIKLGFRPTIARRFQDGALVLVCKRPEPM